MSRSSQDQLSPEALLLEPRKYFDMAMVGVTNDPQDHWPRDEENRLFVAVYDVGRCLEAIVKWAKDDGAEMSYELALEYFYYNTAGCFVGPGTPTFTTELSGAEELLCH